MKKMQSLVCFARISNIFNQAEKKKSSEDSCHFSKNEVVSLNTILFKYSYTWKFLNISNLFHTTLKKNPKCFNYLF